MQVVVKLSQLPVLMVAHLPNLSPAIMALDDLAYRLRSRRPSTEPFSLRGERCRSGTLSRRMSAIINDVAIRCKGAGKGLCIGYGTNLHPQCLQTLDVVNTGLWHSGHRIPVSGRNALSLGMMILGSSGSAFRGFFLS